MTKFYNGSKGPVEIAKMPHRHAMAARDKLVRDGVGKERADEVESLSEHILAMDAAFAEAEAAKAVQS